MVANEIDPMLWIWTLPAARSKNGKPRATPLVGLAREIVREALAGRDSRPLFGTGSGNALTSSHIGTCLLARRTSYP